MDLLAAQESLKSLLQHHSSKASVLQHSAFFMVQLSLLYMTTGKTIALIIWTFVSKVMSLLFNMLSRFVIGFSDGSDGKEPACNADDLGLIPGSGRSLGEGNGNPLQYSYLENPMDGEAWQSTPHGIAELNTTERDTHIHTHTHTHRVCHSFSSRQQVSLNFMAAVTIHSDFGAQENKICHCFHFFPSVYHCGKRKKLLWVILMNFLKRYLACIIYTFSFPSLLLLSFVVSM